MKEKERVLGGMWVFGDMRTFTRVKQRESNKISGRGRGGVGGWWGCLFVGFGLEGGRG